MFLSRCAMARFRNRFLQNTRSYRGGVFHNRSDARYVVRRISVEPPYTSHQSSASTTAMVPWAAAALILVGVLLWFAVPLAVPFAFRLWQNRHGQRGARGDDARSDGVAEQTDADASRELLPRIAAADAAAQAQIASERVRKGVLRRSRRVTFAPDLASDGENRERSDCPRAPRIPALGSARPCATRSDTMASMCPQRFRATKTATSASPYFGGTISSSNSRSGSLSLCETMMHSSSGSQRTEGRLRSRTLSGRSGLTTGGRSSVW